MPFGQMGVHYMKCLQLVRKLNLDFSRPEKFQKNQPVSWSYETQHVTAKICL